MYATHLKLENVFSPHAILILWNSVVFIIVFALLSSWYRKAGINIYEIEKMLCYVLCCNMLYCAALHCTALH